MTDTKERAKRSELDHALILCWQKSHEVENAAVIANKVQIYLKTRNAIYLIDR